MNIGSSSNGNGHGNGNGNGNVDNKLKKKIDLGYEYCNKYSIDNQITKIHNMFLTYCQDSIQLSTKLFLNIILQSYNESNIERRKELEYCILENLNNPYVKWVHDFGYNSQEYLPHNITSHTKYIHVNIDSDSRLKYNEAFEYSQKMGNDCKFGLYWSIVNCDIFLDITSKWDLIKGLLNNGYIMAQSRHEFDILNIDVNTGNNIKSKLDDNFSKLLHAHTQDGWFYSLLQPFQTNKIKTDYGNSYQYSNTQFNSELLKNTNFEIGLLGCDNAIADRIIRFSGGYKLLNRPITFKINHYDIARGKTSSNFLEKHFQESQNKNKKISNDKSTQNTKQNTKKIINTHPERESSFLVPNYDQLVGNECKINFADVFNQMGGVSNLEIYKLISEIMTSRITIYNPD